MATCWIMLKLRLRTDSKFYINWPKIGCNIWAHVLFRLFAVDLAVMNECFRKWKVHLITFLKLGPEIIYAKSHLSDLLKYPLTQESLLFRETHQRLLQHPPVMTPNFTQKFHIFRKESWIHIPSVVSTHQSIGKICCEQEVRADIRCKMYNFCKAWFKDHLCQIRKNFFLNLSIKSKMAAAQFGWHEVAMLDHSQYHHNLFFFLSKHF